MSGDFSSTSAPSGVSAVPARFNSTSAPIYSGYAASPDFSSSTLTDLQTAQQEIAELRQRIEHAYETSDIGQGCRDYLLQQGDFAAPVDAPAACTTCQQPMDSPPCCTTADGKGSHTVDGGCQAAEQVGGAA